MTKGLEAISCDRSSRTQRATGADSAGSGRSFSFPVMALRLQEADTLIQEAAYRNLFFAIDFNHRYARPVQMAHAAVQAGRLGDLVFA